MRPRPGRVVRADLLAEVHAFLRGEPAPADDGALAPVDRPAVTGLDLHR